MIADFMRGHFCRIGVVPLGITSLSALPSRGVIEDPPSWKVMISSACSLSMKNDDVQNYKLILLKRHGRFQSWQTMKINPWNEWIRCLLFGRINYSFVSSFAHLILPLLWPFWSKGVQDKVNPRSLFTSVWWIWQKIIVWQSFPISHSISLKRFNVDPHLLNCVTSSLLNSHHFCNQHMTKILLKMVKWVVNRTPLYEYFKQNTEVQSTHLLFKKIWLWSEKVVQQQALVLGSVLHDTTVSDPTVFWFKIYVFQPNRFSYHVVSTHLRSQNGQFTADTSLRDLWYLEQVHLKTIFA